MTTEKSLEELLIEAEEVNDPSGLSAGRMLHSGNDDVPMPMAVSYTHLTLPTILRV